MSSTKTFINLANKYDRVVVLVDMDCFYCQVEEKLDPSLIGKPVAVVQYNAWKGGGIIAVNYPARSQGVTRHMRGDEAKEQCPEIVLVKVPSVREKADLTKYREAGRDVAAVLQRGTTVLERASVDEAYLDITAEVLQRLEAMDKGSYHLKPSELMNTYAVGYENFDQYINEISSRIENDVDDFDCEEDDIPAMRKSNIKLLIGASIVNEIRAKVKEKTGYDCSAGIAHNKILAKLACGINKPNKQTILPLRQIAPLFSSLPVRKIKGLGGKFGEELCELFNIKYLGELLPFSETELQKRFDEKNGSWLYLMARGIDLETVKPRFYSKSIGCCKKFPGRNAITGMPTLEHWLNELANEICDRMEKDVIENNRKAKQMVVSYIQDIKGDDVSNSRSTPLSIYDAESMAKCAFEVIRKNTDQLIKTGCDGILNNPLKFLGISVGKFETIKTNKNTIEKLFMNHAKKELSENIEKELPKPVAAATKKNVFASYFNTNSGNDPEKTSEEVSSISRAMNSEPATSEPKELKSFFLNAIRRKNADDAPSKKSDSISNPIIVQTVPNASSFSDLNEPSTSSASDYARTYAEFLVPEAKETDFTICKQCNKKILTYEIESHNDFHFALELSQEQRVQFRSEIKTRITSPPSKKARISASNSLNLSKKLPKTHDTRSVQFFFTKSVAEDEASEATKEKCFECGAAIEVGKLVEHLDYHAARKLQTEWNRNSLESSGPLNFASGSAVATSRKKSNASEKSCTNLQAQTKSIRTFFK